MADPDQAFGEQSNWGVPRRSKYQKLSATIVVCHTKEVTFCRSKSGYFCWSNYAIFQGKTTVWKRFISSIQKRFETGPKQWASFFTSYTDLVYLQNVFKRFKSMLRASICHCFGYAPGSTVSICQKILCFVFDLIHVFIISRSIFYLFIESDQVWIDCHNFLA